MKVDIIGGGISGFSTAISLKKYDSCVEVIVHEQYKKIGYNIAARRCGEAHSVQDEWKKWQPSERSIYNTIHKAELIIDNQTHLFHVQPPNKAYILNRPEFIRQLAAEAKSLGVVIQTDDKVKSAEDVDGDYVVDASGCPSILKRKLGINNGIKGIAYQQTLESSNCFVSGTAKIIYTDDFGYYWIFPRDSLKKEVNIGVCFFGQFGYNLKKLLSEFKNKNHLSGTINYETGGLLPEGLQRPLKYKNIVFVGDAGVGTYPFNGQGIYRALLSGEEAGRFLADKNPKGYVHRMNQLFIKWDMIGKMFIRGNFVIRQINPWLVLRLSNIFANSKIVIKI